MTRLGKVGCVFTTITLAVGGYYVVPPFFAKHSNPTPPFGASPDDHYITIKGLKPEDAKVKAYSTFYGGGEQCKSFSWSAVDGKKRKGGKAILLIDHNFSQDESHYELRIPYTNFISNGCDMKQYNIIVDAENAYDTVGFAELRIYPPRMESDKFIAATSFLEAKNCRAKYYDEWQDWSDGFACDYYIDGKMEAEGEFSYFKMRLDFSQFTDDTTIRYNITAGDNYRTEPKAQKKNQ
ncbi:type VI secretion system immunity protein TsiV1 [Vibrio owensii]